MTGEKPSRRRHLQYRTNNGMRNFFFLIAFFLISGQAKAETTESPRPLQPCTNIQLDAVASKLGQSGDISSRAVSVACTSAPSEIGASIVAFILKPDGVDEGKLYLGVLDTEKRVTSASAVDVSEDASMRFVEDTVRIDVAPYTLAAGTRAFGIDLVSGYLPNCGDGGIGATRTLYVRDGNGLRPVLADLLMTEWSFVQQSQWRCNNNENSPPTTIIEDFTRTIVLGKVSANGYRDIFVNGRSRLRIIDEHGHETVTPSHRKPFRYRIQYDGRTYPIDAMESAWWKWRD